ncbi:NHLP family bacteriocin export ABC transporter peptidase/permease/ATPase subunit [Cohnella lubricantis]|uniref:NHLP family bacteriocin export ABC transporter peptidase/permease/ATPase subunit n=2 Tax=Cohnella lubricantis TaxID=2163172 RepID=UPI00315A0F9B|nr:NHLM bacteriocin system ABC transporter peptidase/ATP-binding protein [Cohnella lubricantis]
MRAWFGRIRRRGDEGGGAAPAARRVKTPTVLQMEAVECGAAALAIVLAHYGRHVPLELLRVECGVSRDGSKALNIVKAARAYELGPKAYRKEPHELRTIGGPMIIHWEFNHFVVLEGFGRNKVYLNDPASGPRTVSYETFDEAFTGVVITFEPTAEFTQSRERWQTLRSLRSRLTGAGDGIAYAVLAGLLLVVPGLVIPAFSRIFVDDILLGGLQSWLLPLLIGMGLTALLRGVLTLLRQHFLNRLQAGMAMNMSGKFFWHVLRLPLGFFQQRHAGEIASRIGINGRLAQLLGGELAGTALDLLMIVFYFILLIQYNWPLTLLGLAISLANFGYLRLVSRAQIDRNRKLMLDAGKLQGVSMSGLSMMETLKSSGSESDFFARWAGWQSKLMNTQMKLGEMGQALSAVPTFLSALNSTVILIAGGLLVMNGSFTVGMLVAFQSLMASFIGPVGRVLQLATAVQEVSGSLARLDDVYRYPLDAAAAREDQPRRAADVGVDAGAEHEAVLAAWRQPKLQGALELSGVTFGYSPLDPPLIQDFSLRLKPGEHVALVGGTGSGKSTIARLITGLYEPQAGEITFDGRARADIPRAVMAGSLASVDQEIRLFQGSIRDNLTLWDDTVPANDLIEACRDAGIHDDIMARPGGYEHEVSENGANFSGGQRQRLEIARALCGKPSLVVLDEATSALDPVTEKRVIDSLKRRGCTCVMVAHRLSTIRDADEIIVLDGGRIIERGSHDELIRRGGAYKALVTAD